MLRLSRVKALRSYLKQYVRLKQCLLLCWHVFYIATENSSVCFMMTLTFRVHLVLKLSCYVLLCLSSVGTKSYRYLRPFAFLLHAGDSITLGL